LHSGVFLIGKKTGLTTFIVYTLFLLFGVCFVFWYGFPAYIHGYCNIDKGAWMELCMFKNQYGSKQFIYTFHRLPPTFVQ
jgi:hypothetical protein